MSKLIRRLFCTLRLHRLVKVARLSGACDLIACVDCGRKWGMSHNVRQCLPWEDVRSLYEGPDAIFPESQWVPYTRSTPAGRQALEEKGDA